MSYDLQSLRDLLAAAMCGRLSPAGSFVLVDGKVAISVLPLPDHVDASEADNLAALIAGSVNALPAILDRLEAAEKCIADVRMWNGFIRQYEHTRDALAAYDRATNAPTGAKGDET